MEGERNDALRKITVNGNFAPRKRDGASAKGIGYAAVAVVGSSSSREVFFAGPRARMFWRCRPTNKRTTTMMMKTIQIVLWVYFNWNRALECLGGSHIQMRIGIALFRGAQAHFNEPNYYIFFVSKVFTFLFQRHPPPPTTYPRSTLLF